MAGLVMEWRGGGGLFPVLIARGHKKSRASGPGSA
jgi:hypothetical protein